VDTDETQVVWSKYETKRVMDVSFFQWYKRFSEGR